MQYRFLARFASVAALASLASLVSASAPTTRIQPDLGGAPPVRITVFKDPNCGCCKSWIEHLRKHGFEVAARDTSDVGAVKRAGRVPERLHSCHTAFVNGYVVEGHVPAPDIRRLLTDKPRIAGLAVPGMPVGSPGMEMGGRVESYDVIAFNRDGTTRVFARH
jgi:hypothetical protein